MVNPLYVEVITSPECTHSPKAVSAVRKAALKRKSVVLLEVSIATKQGMERAQEYSVRATPTIAVNGCVAYQGVPKAKVLDKILNDAERNEREKTSYFA